MIFTNLYLFNFNNAYVGFKYTSLGPKYQVSLHSDNWKWLILSIIYVGSQIVFISLMCLCVPFLQSCLQSFTKLYKVGVSYFFLVQSFVKEITIHAFTVGLLITIAIKLKFVQYSWICSTSYSEIQTS